MTWFHQVYDFFKNQISIYFLEIKISKKMNLDKEIKENI